MSVMIVSAATSKVTVDQEEVTGLQSLEFTVKRRQQDVESVGQGLRIGVESGLATAMGTLRIRSLNKKLDDLLYMPVPVPFTLVATLMKGDTKVKTITFQDCYLDDKSFELGANAVASTVYNFTSTNIKEE